MRVSSAFCRQQISIQDEIASSHPLESRRQIAVTAAKAWGLEAVEAVKREAGHQNVKDKLDAAITIEFANETATAAMLERTLAND